MVVVNASRARMLKNEEVDLNIEGFGDVLEPFEVGSKAKSGYAHESIVDPSVGT